MIEGREADDALGCAQTKETCIVSIDKDLDMIPGAHYNFVKDQFYEVNEEQAWHSFYKQLLTGDRTDNIPGITGIGPKKAEKLLDGHKGQMDLHRRVEQAYKEHYAKDALSLMNERGSLLWIQREPGVVWTA